VTDSDLPEKAPVKPAAHRGLHGRLKERLQLIGGALASIAAVGAVASGLLGYWNIWKTVRTELFQEAPNTQREAAARGSHGSTF
jgi:adenylate cyclase